MTTAINPPSAAAPLSIPSTPPPTTAIPSPDLSLVTGLAVRLAARATALTSCTSGLAQNYVQANLIVLPSRFAADFRLLCARNPVPCPLVAESASAGAYASVRSHVPGVPGPRLLSDVDLRRDCPAYNVYRDGHLVPASPKSPRTDIAREWTDDHVAFLVGCSYSFESALVAAGLVPPHTELGRNVPMYRTNIPLCPAGVFDNGTYVVSMRPYRASKVERVRAITRDFSATHGEPVAWGWDAVARLGIADVDVPDWGDAPVTREGRPLGARAGDADDDEEVPVFWGCGVTPQEAVMRAGLEGTVMAHAPGHMLLLDIKDAEIVAG